MSDFYLYKYGRFGDVDTAGEDVWDMGSNYLFPAVAFETKIVGLANDHVSSNGVHSVKVLGLDINGLEITEIATLTGATPVTLANSYYRVNRAYIQATGASLINSGFIDVTHTGSATLARISPLAGQTLQAIYTMPAAVNGHFSGWGATCGRAASRGDVAGTLALQTREVGKGWRTRDTIEIVDGQFYARRYGSPDAIPIKALTDIRVRVTATNTDNWAISTNFEINGFRNVR